MAPPAFRELTLPSLPPRPSNAHKGCFGEVLVVAGCRRYPGAAVLAALGAGRMGAGLVRLAVPAAIVPEVLSAVPFAVIERGACDAQGHFAAESLPALLAAAATCEALVLGPGLGTAAGPAAIVAGLLREVRAPLVLDADGLNLLAAGGMAQLADRPGPSVLTPHPGEFVRLEASLTCGRQEAGDPGRGDPSPPTSPPARTPTPLPPPPPTPRGRDERCTRAAALARALAVVLVLKGKGSVTTDGTRLRVETAGNPGLATGGSGDVLAGVAGTLLAQLNEPLGAAALAVHLHALAGDLVAAELGQTALLPQDLAAALGRAARACRGD